MQKVLSNMKIEEGVGDVVILNGTECKNGGSSI
jgi:hypothetical protein